jgi:hypothetical protein
MSKKRSGDPQRVDAAGGGANNTIRVVGFGYPPLPAEQDTALDEGFVLTVLSNLAQAKTLAGKPPQTNSAADEAALDERAVAVKVAHPDWTDQQVAETLGCHPKTLFKPNMVKYKLAKAALKSIKDEKYRRGPQADRRRGGRKMYDADTDDE